MVMASGERERERESDVSPVSNQFEKSEKEDGRDLPGCDNVCHLLLSVDFTLRLCWCTVTAMGAVSGQAQVS